MIAGVDPGLSGGIAFLDGAEIQTFEMPTQQPRKGRKVVDCAILGSLLSEFSPDHLFLELVRSMPSDGHAGAFSFGRAFGAIEGACGGLLISLSEVTPARWKKDFSLIGQDKTASRARAAALFPKIAEDFRRVRDDGRAEAALIAEWGRRFLGAGR